MSETHLDIVEATMGGWGFTACDLCRQAGIVDEGTKWYDDGGLDDEGEWLCEVHTYDRDAREAESPEGTD